MSWLTRLLDGFTYDIAMLFSRPRWAGPDMGNNSLLHGDQGAFGSPWTHPAMGLRLPWQPSTSVIPHWIWTKGRLLLSLWKPISQGLARSLEPRGRREVWAIPALYGDDMDDDTKTKRLPPYSYRPPVELREEFDRRIAESGLSVSAFLTKAWSGALHPSQGKAQSQKEKLLAKLLADAGSIKARLNDVATTAPKDQSTAQLYADIQAELQLIRTAIMRDFRRK